MTDIATAPALKLDTTWKKARFGLGATRREALKALTAEQLHQLNEMTRDFTALKEAIYTEQYRRAGLTY